MNTEFDFLPDDPVFREKCERLHRELVAANEHVNLTRITERQDFYIKHVADSLLLLKAFPGLPEERFSIADIGCGAGFPSLILALAHPRWKICAIDSTGKKTAFVARMKDVLELHNLRVITGRSRELDHKPEFRRMFDVVTARAVATAPVLVADTRNFLRASGRYILYKTPDQVAEDLPLMGAFPGTWRASAVYSLPEGAGERQFLFSVPDSKA